VHVEVEVVSWEPAEMFPGGDFCRLEKLGISLYVIPVYMEV
jgi:hypothetical protein